MILGLHLICLDDTSQSYILICLDNGVHLTGSLSKLWWDDSYLADEYWLPENITFLECALSVDWLMK